MNIIGLIPMGGKATRMYGIPKYMLPTPDGTLLDVLQTRMNAAGVQQSVEIRSPGLTVCDALLKVDERHTYTLFAMPDTYWTDSMAFKKVLATLLRGADVAVGVWEIRPEQRGKLGMCQLGIDNAVLKVVDKNPDCPHVWAWGAVAWRVNFWECVHTEDAHLGIPLNRAIESGLKVQAVKMTGHYWDCGTPAEYFQLCSTWVQEAVTHG